MHKLKYVFVALGLFTLLSCENLGKVKGTVCYPSEYYPAMNIYAKNIATRQVYSTSTEEGINKFEIDDLRPGEYIAYAYTKEKLFGDADTPYKEKGSGGYFHAVPCGLRVDCDNHDLIVFKIIGGKTTNMIEICDWYGAVVPEE